LEEFYPCEGATRSSQSFRLESVSLHAAMTNGSALLNAIIVNTKINYISRRRPTRDLSSALPSLRHHSRFVGRSNGGGLLAPYPKCHLSRHITRLDSLRVDILYQTTSSAGVTFLPFPLLMKEDGGTAPEEPGRKSTGVDMEPTRFSWVSLAAPLLRREGLVISLKPPS
jgi:hypothetical protein